MKQLMKKTLMGAALATSLAAPSLTWGCDESKHETKTEAKAEIKEAKNARPPARPFRDDLSTYNETLWHKNGPWANDGIFRSAWRPENVLFKDDIMTLLLDDTKSSERESIVWLVDGKEVGRATAKLGPIPSVPGEIMTNVWATQNADGWAGPFEYSKPIQAHYDWMKWTPLADMKSVPRATK